MRLVVASTVAAGLLLGAAACGGDDEEDAPRPLRATLDLPTEPRGAADAGRAGGHGGGYEATVEGMRLAFHGRADPPDADVAVTGAPATAQVLGGGRFVVRVAGLRAARTDLRVRLRAPSGSAWSREVRVYRTRSVVPAAREPQGTEPNRGSPGVGDAYGGKRDVEVRDFAFSPRRLEVEVGQIVVFRTRDRADHAIADRSGRSALRARRMTAGDRYEFTARRAGRVRYACAIHPWMTGELDVV